MNIVMTCLREGNAFSILYDLDQSNIPALTAEK